MLHVICAHFIQLKSKQLGDEKKKMFEEIFIAKHFVPGSLSSPSCKT